MSASDFNAAVAATKFAAVNAIGLAYGNIAKGMAEVAFGHPLMLTQIAAMGEKKEDGSLDSGDYAAGIKILTDIAIGTALAGGATISLPVAVAWGITGAGIFIYNNRENISGIIDSFERGTIPGFGPHDPSLYSPNSSVAFDVNFHWRSATQPRPRDPLAIDLDGDGIETVGIPASGDPILFDHDADGIRTGTGWLKADDGWLVLDRDGNGRIDTGRELFGVDTLISVTQIGADGQPQTVVRNATSGFEALKSLDTGNGNAGSAGYRDLVFNANDTAFANVKIWKDLNQDGMSQAAELLSLSTAGVASISLVSTNTNTNLGNGNSLTGTAVVTQTSGASTQMGSVLMQAGNLNLSNNPFYREFADTIPLTSAAASLPEMGGSGLLRDLREAMSLNSPYASKLVAAVQAFSQAGSRDAQWAAVDAVLSAWAQTSPQANDWLRAATTVPSEALAWFSNPRNAAVLDVEHPGWRDLLPAANFSYGGLNGAANQLLQIARSHDLLTSWGFVSPPGNTPTPAQLLVQSPFYLTVDHTSGVLRQIAILEVFNGVNAVGQMPRATVTGWNGWTVTLGVPDSFTSGLMDKAYKVLSESVYSALSVQTRLRPYLDAIELAIDETGIRFNVQGLASKLDQAKSIHERDGFGDLVDLIKYSHEMLDLTGFSSIQTLRAWRDGLPATSTLRSELLSMGVLTPAQSSGSDAWEIYLGDASGNNFSAGEGNDIADGADGNDSLSGGGGDDKLIGGAGSDGLQGGNGDDTLDGGTGNDILAGGIYDTWNGYYWGYGNDTYLFGRGDGQDAVWDRDATAGVVDRLVFKAGVLPADLQYWRSGDHLFLKIANTTDQVQLINYFGADATNGWQIEQIAFSDAPQTVWSVADLKLMVLAGDAGINTLIGYASDDVLTGLEGNDTLAGRAGNDVLDGGAGADSLMGEDGSDALLGGTDGDVLQGGNGDDTLDGGTGNDILAGGIYDTWNGSYWGYGNDTYRFGRGDGQDAVWDRDATAGVVDRLVFKAGVLPADLQYWRTGDHLFLKIANTTDQVQLINYFGADATNGWQIEQVTFADAPQTVWSVADMKLMVLTGDGGNNALIGYASDDVLRGLEGNDTLAGRAGNDTLDGGAGGDSLMGEDGNDALLGGADGDVLQGGNGDDTLDGGAGNDILAGGIYDTWNGYYWGYGNDTYRFGRGDGQDAVWDRDSTAGVVDRLVFKAGVLPADLQYWRSGDHLFLKIANTTDQVQLINYFGVDATNGWQIEQIAFTDAPQTVWSVADMKLMVLTGDGGNNALIGYASDDVLTGLEGNDTLAGRAGNDVLDGGAGADSLMGEDGSDALLGGTDGDVLQGGAGDDTLDGGTGNDILAGGIYDTWNGYYWGYGNDTYRFGRGDGQDAVWDRDSTAGVVDRLVFKAGVLPADLQYWRTGDHLFLKIANTTDQVQLINYFGVDATNGWQIEQVTFADAPQTVWSVADMKLMVLTGDGGNNALIGYASDDVLRGLEGNDTLAGRAGNDTLDGGAGGDSLMGEDGNDVLLGGADGDVLQGGAGDDTLDGGTGNDILAGGIYDTWNGYYWGYGNDTYRFGRGDGQDAIWDRDATANVTDKLVFKAGVLPADLQYWRTGDHLFLKIANTTDQIQLTNYFGADATNGWQIEQVSFTDAPQTVWSVADMKLMVLTGDGGNNTLIGYASDDVLRGLEGNDTLAGRAGNDTLDGGAGGDSLMGEDGNDALLGGADGDVLQGGNGDDTLDGGTGNDILAGGIYDTWNGRYTGPGNDTYLFGRGDGQDTVWDNDTTAGNLDRLFFKAGVLPSDVVLSRSGNSLLAKINGTTDQITVQNYFLGDGAAGWALEEIRFTDSPATVWSVAAVKLIVSGGRVAAMADSMDDADSTDVFASGSRDVVPGDDAAFAVAASPFLVLPNGVDDQDPSFMLQDPFLQLTGIADFPMF